MHSEKCWRACRPTGTRPAPTQIGEGAPAAGHANPESTSRSRDVHTVGAVGTYAPASALGWLDLDAAASERAAVLLRAFEEPGTLDPLGLGAIRDVFSNVFAPGTSTIQTRLRYFLFVPWICQGLESARVTPGEFAARLRADEARLIQQLRHLGPNRGVQGYSAGRDLRRMPSEAYWGGIGSWGIRRLDLSIREYGRQIRHLSGRTVELDDDHNPVATSRSMWATLPPPPEGFLNQPVDFDLTADEAVVLIDHIRRLHPQSLLAHACRSPADAASAEQPWDLRTGQLPPLLQESLHHARCVSELTLGPQHVYNLLLAQRATSELGWDTTVVTAAIEADLDAWVSVVDQRSDELSGWASDIESFWSYVARHDTIAAPSISFITEIVTRAAQDPARFVNDPAVHQLIRDREIRLKGPRARLGPRAALETWNQARFGGPLVYRWPTARSYLGDLGRALAGAA